MIFRTALMAVALLGPAAPSDASIHRCSEWSDAGLRHKGDVVIAVSEELLEWSTPKASSTAELVSHSAGASVYADRSHVYFVFGILFNAALPNQIDRIMRIAITRQAKSGTSICAWE